MHLDVAYSLEWKDYITAEEAYELFWSAHIKDKRAFQCPEDVCDGQVTCANMDKPEQSLKVQPYFKAYSHSPACPILLAEQSRDQAAEGGDPTAEGLGEDVFQLSRPASHDARDKGEPAGSGFRIGQGTSPARNRTRGPVRRQLFTVRSLVTRWVKHRQSDTDTRATVSVGEAEGVPYNTLFESIYPNRKAPILVRPRVYWGKAWVTAMNNGDYRIAFHSGIELQDDAGAPLAHEKPAIFVDKSSLESYRTQRLLEPQLREAAEGKKPVLAFVYATPKVRTTQHPTKGDRIFINFDASNLDMLCLHPMAFFEELKRDS
ncbi:MULTISPECIES: hypothetical protein [Dyella]|uniref:Uncharacterized protein n=2 Tax=Dyella TaxID=231454 RepID=A0A4R0Z0E5_9GAMM|nr:MULTISPECIES: hypothetical protein [Dyella]TBR39589.1 hypothetical protein EYV96_05130 [Dyella terrae]TCI12828.1 hypothetical protein EZM97_05740 [Dyella soli]